ncbi:MAG: NAD-dependent epimerase/dehydratase family protein [Planctomycetes bacterium]|nr:NAD-dependent epimerase/dehydratase family protein [Planctomycetota bacterium]
MGGTGFLGPHTVRALLARGHEVTLFNRGRTNTHLFPELEKLQGDRSKDLSALAGDRKWDFVVDTSGYYPRVVDMLAEAVKDRVGAYVFISTMSVYPDWMGANTEESELATLEDPTTEQVTGGTYGGLKVLCEQAAERHWPGRTLNIRPGLIVGPGDNSDRLTWWPVRIHRGGEVIAPGHWDMPVRFIDARDLAEWTVRCMEDGTFGPFNAIGPEGGLNMAELLFGCKVVLGAECNFTWVTNEFLAEQKVNAWSGPDSLPIWVPLEPPFETSSWAKARAAGLTHRPTGDTLRDTLKWALEERGEDRPWRSGVTPEREAQLLKDWKERPPESEDEPGEELESVESGSGRP